MREVRNPKNKPKIQMLNDKIRQYNIACESANKDERLCLNLLNEINYMANEIRQLSADDSSKAQPYYDITAFEGIAQELQKYQKPAANGKGASALFTEIIASKDGLPTPAQWVAATSRKRYFVSHQSTQARQINSEVQALNDEKKKIRPGNREDIEKYHNNLKAFKESIQNKLAYGLVKPRDLQQFRQLLSQVNKEIIEVQNQHPILKDNYEKGILGAKSQLAQDFSQIPADNMVVLISLLKNPKAVNPGPPTREDIENIAPILKQYNLKKLGGGNNANWLLTNPETKEQFVIQIGVPSKNQQSLAKANTGSAEKHLTQEYYASDISFDTPFQLVITEYASGGDLHHERETKFANNNPDEITRQGIHRLQQLTSLCASFQACNIMNSDIKLTNFLISSNGEPSMSDKKAVNGVNENGNISSPDFITTEDYAPPEFFNENKDNINAEAFTSYQLGMALYDYLVAPKVPDDPKAPAWFQQKPLDFNHEIFQSLAGKQLETLIRRMTDPDPSKRPKLTEIQNALERVKQVAATNVQDLGVKNNAGVGVVQNLKVPLQLGFMEPSVPSLAQEQKHVPTQPVNESLEQIESTTFGKK